MRTATSHIARLSAFTLLAHGDFSASLANVCDAPLAVAALPHRRIFFLTDPALVSEATLSRASALRDRQDPEASGGGIVGACGDEWTRRRERLRMLLGRECTSLAVPAVTNALSACGCPSEALLLPPAEMLPWSGRVVRDALRRVAIATEREADGPPVPGYISPRRRGGIVASVIAPLFAPLLRTLALMLGWVLRLSARLALLSEHAVALLGRTPFFDVAELFTNRKRKIERRVSTWRSSITGNARRRDESGASWIEAAVHAREESLASSAAASPPRDLLDVLIAPPRTLSTEEVVDVLKDVLTAGGDTTSSTLSTAALLLQQHPAAAARVAEEARAAFGPIATDDDSLVGCPSNEMSQSMAAVAEQPSRLLYTRAVLQEATRLFPAAPLLLRVALEETSIGGVTIPSGSGLVASTAQLGRNPEAWEQPDEFVPERFIPGHPLYRSADGAKAYMAFGAGPRSCIGQQLALTISSLVLARMVFAAESDELLPE